MPMPVTARNHASVPPRTGEKRISRNTPALTIVALCRKAETGVGADIAPGSQKWNGTCADLVNAPSRNSARIAPYIGCSRTCGPAASTTSRSWLPTTWPSISIASNRHSPPIAVISSAVRAPSRAAWPWCQNPISRNDTTDVSSQNTTSISRLPDRRMPCIAPVNAISSAKKRGRRSLPAM